MLQFKASDYSFTLYDTSANAIDSICVSFELAAKRNER